MMDEREKKVLETVKEVFTDCLGDSLVGIYVHGSTALGGFVWERSDIDFLVVVNRKPTFDEKMQVMKNVVNIHKNSNPRGIEMSIVMEEYCKKPVFPVPFELHFSSGTIDWFMKEPEQYCKNMNGDDADIGSYLAVIKQAGIVLTGSPIDQVFGEVPKEFYEDSIMSDIKDAKEEFLEDFAYHTLNLCRTVAYYKDGIIRSKKAGGMWGLENLPTEFEQLIQKALDVYVNGQEITCTELEAKVFVDYIFHELNR